MASMSGKWRADHCSHEESLIDRFMTDETMIKPWDTHMTLGTGNWNFQNGTSIISITVSDLTFTSCSRPILRNAQ
jgi:hypothetical protein